MENHIEEHPNNPSGKAPKKKMGWLGRILIIVGILVVLALAAVAVLGFNLLNRLSRPQVPTSFEQEDTPQPTASPTAQPGASPLPTFTPAPTEMPLLPLNELYAQTQLTSEQYAAMDAHNKDTSNYTNILLLGVDRRSSTGNARSDTMMIATIDKKNKRIKLTSLMRDLLVDIPGVGEGRLNSATTKGGIPLLMQTLEHNLHITLKQYILVDFRMFQKIVDKLGGVTVRMTTAEISAANDCIAGLNKEWGVDYLWDGFIFANAGNVKLTGKQALGFARVRHIDSDFSRTDRQFKILSAIFAKFMTRSLTQKYDILYDLMPMVETNLTNAEIIDAAMGVLGTGVDGMLHYRVPADNTYRSSRYEGSAVLIGDLSQNAWLAHEFIFESTEVPDPAKVLSPGKSNPPRTPSPSQTPIILTPEPIDGGGELGTGLAPIVTPTPTPTPALPSPG
ncbi:MAG: LCP family protein [Bacillota bacterium]